MVTLSPDEDFAVATGGKANVGKTDGFSIMAMLEVFRVRLFQNLIGIGGS